MAKRNPAVLNEQAENIRRDGTKQMAPRPPAGEPYTADQIFTPANGWPNLLPPTEYPDGPKRTQFLDPQHANFNREFVGSLDGIDRSGNLTGGDLGIEVLPASFMGARSDPVPTPLKNAPMTPRSSMNPHGARSGSASSTGNRLDR